MQRQDVIVSGILSRDGQVLLAKRSSTKHIAPGVYHLPGGHMEFGEDPENALIREFQEEFELDITIKRIVRAFSYVKDDLHTIGITYEVACADIPEVIKIDNEDNEEIVWVDEDSLSNYFGENHSDHDSVTLKYYFSN